MDSPLGIIAGKGQLPVDVVASLSRQGRGIFIIRLEDMADPALASYPGIDLNMGCMQSGIDALRSAACKDLVFAGYITRPDFARVHLDTLGSALLPKIMAAAQCGDNAVIDVFLNTFRQAGFNVLGADEAYRDILCSEGVITRTQPGADHHLDLEKAFQIAGVIGREDIGQACIVCRGLVLAVEAQEGTDAMLARITGLDKAIRGTEVAPAGVLVKRTKAGQDRRVDLPVIGPATIPNVVAAGLAGIGLEAGASLIVDRAATLSAADAAGLFIIGLPPAPLISA